MDWQLLSIAGVPSVRQPNEEFRGGAVGTILKHSRYADNRQAKNRGLDRDGLLARHSAAVMRAYWSVGRVPQNGRGNEKQSMAIPARLSLKWRLRPVIS